MTVNRLIEIPLTIRKKSEIHMSYYDIPDHPVIRNMERTGYPDGKEPEYPHCPRCGDECGAIYSYDGDIIGCDECLTSKDAAEHLHTPDDAEPICPLCDQFCETLYLNKDNEVVGCDVCIDCKDAWETESCFPQRD